MKCQALVGSELAYNRSKDKKRPPVRHFGRRAVCGHSLGDKSPEWILAATRCLVIAVSSVVGFPKRFVGTIEAIETVESALGFLLGFFLLLALGFATKNYLGNRVLYVWEQMLAKVPVLSTVYGGVKQLLEALFLVAASGI